MSTRGTIKRRMANSRALAECHQLVHAFDAIQRIRGESGKKIGEAAGMSEGGPNNWRRGHEPGVAKFDRALRCMGYRLAIVPLDGRPDEPVID